MRPAVPLARRAFRPIRGLWAPCLLVWAAACGSPKPRAEPPRDDGLASAPSTSGEDLPVAPGSAAQRGDRTSTDRPIARGAAVASAPPVARPAGVIYRHELMRATHEGRPPYLMRQLGPEAHKPNGRFLGWRITTVWPGDPELCAPGCDLRPGDVIVTVNGQPIQYPEQLSDQMAKLQTMDELRVQMLRDGKLTKKSWTIVDR